jgi:hypothetical protein
MLLLAHQLGILLLLRLPPTLSSSAALADLVGLGLLRLFGVLAVDLGENLLDARVGVGVDEVAEQVGQAEQVSKAADGVVFL